MADGATERERFLEEYGDLVMDDTKEQLATLPDAFLSSALPDLAEIAQLRGEAILEAVGRLAEVGGMGDEWIRGAARDIRSQYGLAVAEQAIDVISGMLADEGRAGDADAQADLLDSVARHVRAMAGAMRSGSMGLLGGSGTDGWVDGVSEESADLVMVDGMLPAGGEAGWTLDWTADGMADGERVTLDDAILSPVVSVHDLSLRGRGFLVAAHARELLRDCECSFLLGLREELVDMMSVVLSCSSAIGLATRVEAILSDREAQEIQRMVCEAAQEAYLRASSVARDLYAYAPEDEWGDDYRSFLHRYESLLCDIDSESAGTVWQDDFPIFRLDIDGSGRVVYFLDDKVRHLPRERFWKEVREMCLLVCLWDALRSASFGLCEEGADWDSLDGGSPVRRVDLSGAATWGMGMVRHAVSVIANRVLPAADGEWEEMRRTYLALGSLVSKVAGWEASHGGFDGYASVPVPCEGDWEVAGMVREGRIEGCHARRRWVVEHPGEDGEFALGSVTVWIPADMRGFDLMGDLGMSERWAKPLARDGVSTLGDLVGLAWEDLVETGHVSPFEILELKEAFVSLGLVDESSQVEDGLDESVPIDDLLAVLFPGSEGGDPAGEGDCDDLI